MKVAYFGTPGSADLAWMRALSPPGKVERVTITGFDPNTLTAARLGPSGHWIDSTGARNCHSPVRSAALWFRVARTSPPDLIHALDEYGSRMLAAVKRLCAQGLAVCCSGRSAASRAGSSDSGLVITAEPTLVSHSSVLLPPVSAEERARCVFQLYELLVMAGHGVRRSIVAGRSVLIATRPTFLAASLEWLAQNGLSLEDCVRFDPYATRRSLPQLLKLLSFGGVRHLLLEPHPEYDCMLYRELHRRFNVTLLASGDPALEWVRAHFADVLAVDRGLGQPTNAS